MKNKFIKFVIIFLLSIFARSALAQEETIKLQFSIFDESGSFVSDLKTSDIQFLQDKKPLLVSSIKSKTDSPLEVVIMIDSSASQERMLPLEKKFAENIINEVLIKEKDKVAIVKFSGEIFLTQDLTDNFSKAKEQLKLIEFEPPVGYVGGGIVASRLPPNSKQTAKGSTSIWDSLKDVIEAFSKLQNTDSRQIVILISDGVNTYGDGKLKEVVFSSLKNQVSIYAVGIGDDLYDGVDKKTLKKLTEQTNGILVLPNDKQKTFTEQIERLKNSLRPIYEATFKISKTESKDSLQEVKIEIVNPALLKKKLQIIQPKGFVIAN